MASMSMLRMGSNIRCRLGPFFIMNIICRAYGLKQLHVLLPVYLYRTKSKEAPPDVVGRFEVPGASSADTACRVSMLDCDPDGS
jgi:hypothetical protein